MNTGPLDGIEADGDTKLIRAVKQKNQALVQELLQSGANPNVPGNLGNFPLHHAVYQENVPMFKLLMQYGANPDLIADLRFQKDPQRAIKKSPRQIAAKMNLTGKLGIASEAPPPGSQAPQPPRGQAQQPPRGQAQQPPLVPSHPPPQVPGMKIEDYAKQVYLYYHHGKEDGVLDFNLLSRLTPQELSVLMNEFASQRGHTVPGGRGGPTWGAANYEFLMQEHQRRLVQQQAQYLQPGSSQQHAQYGQQPPYRQPQQQPMPPQYRQSPQYGQQPPYQPQQPMPPQYRQSPQYGQQPLYQQQPMQPDPQQPQQVVNAFMNDNGYYFRVMNDLQNISAAELEAIKAHLTGLNLAQKNAYPGGAERYRSDLEKLNKEIIAREAHLAAEKKKGKKEFKKEPLLPAQNFANMQFRKGELDPKPQEGNDRKGGPKPK